MSTSAPARQRAGYELPRRKPYSTVLGTVIVAAIIIAYVGGLVLVDTNMSAGDEIPHGTVIEVGAGVSYVPADGFSFDNGRTNATGEVELLAPAVSIITRDAELFSVVARPWTDSVDALIDRTKDQIESGSGIRVFTDTGTFQNDHGIEFSTFGYSGVDVEGRVWINVSDAETAIVVTASAPDSEFFRSFDDYEEMVDTIELNSEASASE